MCSYSSITLELVADQEILFREAHKLQERSTVLFNYQCSNITNVIMALCRITISPFTNHSKCNKGMFRTYLLGDQQAFLEQIFQLTCVGYCHLTELRKRKHLFIEKLNLKSGEEFLNTQHTIQIVLKNTTKRTIT